MDSNEVRALRQKTAEILRSERLVPNTNHTELTIQTEFAEAYGKDLSLTGQELIDFISRQNTGVTFESDSLFTSRRKFLIFE